MKRREFLSQTSLMVGGALLPAGLPTSLASGQQQEEVVPFADTKPFNPEKPLIKWEELTSWQTPSDQLFWVGHYGIPQPAAADWALEIDGLVNKQMRLSLDEIRRLPKREYMATIECSGNGAAGGMIGNMKWAGTPLAGVLKSCGLRTNALEVVFFGVDRGTEKIRNNDYSQQFARSLTVPDATADTVLLAYEMNGEPLTNKHGAPVRLVVPGWYGVAWVKWLNRIEVHDRPYLNRFMGRDYVTIRGEQKGAETIWRETSVGKMNLKSVVARVVKRPDGVVRISGAAWSDGTPIQRVELRIDNSPWLPVTVENNHKDRYTWRLWSFDWKKAGPGEHTLTSRAVDTNGKIQPSPDDPYIALKKTYWEANQQAVRKITL